MGFSRTVTFAGPCGRIEGILHGRDDAPYRRLAVVCHPHPLYGGTMHTKAVHRAARGLEASGHRVLRFNFRGVGRSEGSHDRGDGEREDARAAFAHLRSLHPGLPMTAAGFSFGSWVALRAAEGVAGIDALVAIAAPMNLYDFGFLARSSLPKLFVHGASDEIAPLDALERAWLSIGGPKSLARIEGATHLLVEHLDEVESAIREFASRLPGKTTTSGG